MNTTGNIMKKYPYVRGREENNNPLVASHCLKEDIEERRKCFISFLLEMRFSIG
jgi:hypothetical protein